MEFELIPIRICNLGRLMLEHTGQQDVSAREGPPSEQRGEQSERMGKYIGEHDVGRLRDAAVGGDKLHGHLILHCIMTRRKQSEWIDIDPGGAPGAELQSGDAEYAGAAAVVD